VKCLKNLIQKFKNANLFGCTHIKEQNCGIKKAIKDGKISQERYERYCTIYEELKDKEKHRW